MPGSPPRYLLYSHDTYGLGHLRRSTLIADGIVSGSPDAHVLIATGAPQALAFTLPDRVDSLKLPSATKDGAGRYRPRRITGDIDELIALRSSLLAAACEQFRPDVVIVDQAPIGMGGELIPMLQALADRPDPPRLVLGLRDIVDDVVSVEREWAASGAWGWLDRYDDVFVYGDPSIETTARELRLHERVRARVTHTGYIAPAMPARSPADPYLLVTVGGGGDGQDVLHAYLDAVDEGATAGVRSVIVTGPLMSAAHRAELIVRAEPHPQVEIVEFADDMRGVVASAAGVVSMAGYNTVVEVLAAGTPAMLLPRVSPRVEQDIRARRLGPHTNLERCPLEHFNARRVAAFVDRIGAASSAPPRVAIPPDDPPSIDLGGVGRVAELLACNCTRERIDA